MAPHDPRPPAVNSVAPATAQDWETLDEDDTDCEVGDDAPLVMPLHHRNRYNDAELVDLESHGQGSNQKGEEHYPLYEDFGGVLTEEQQSLRAFYDHFQADRPPPMRHFSFSEESSSNESSPLLNPLKPMAKGTPSKLWFYRLWRWYNQCLHRRPVVTKSITAGVIVSLGDVVGQCMVLTSSSATSFDLVRLARFCSMGLFLQAPVTHYYYLALDHYLPPTPDNPCSLVTFVKLLIDQTTYAPAFLFAVFVYMGLVEGDSWSIIWEQLQREYVGTMVANWKLWVPATLLNMAYVSPKFRVLYCNVIFFIWSIFLSIILNEEPPTNGR